MHTFRQVPYYIKAYLQAVPLFNKSIPSGSFPYSIKAYLQAVPLFNKSITSGSSLI